MIKIFIFIPSLLLIQIAGIAQTKVANYSSGKLGTDQYEHFDFWIKEGKRSEINYSYGKRGKEIKLTYLGKDQVNGQGCFKVQFFNGYILNIVSKRNQLQITDSSGKYNKTFSWEYEGPVNGIGTHCDVCAEDEEDAIAVINSSFLK